MDVIYPGEDAKMFDHFQIITQTCTWRMVTYSKPFTILKPGREFTIKLFDEFLLTQLIKHYITPYITFCNEATEDNLKRVIESTMAQSGSQFSSPNSKNEDEETKEELPKAIQDLSEELGNCVPFTRGQLFDDLSDRYSKAILSGNMMTYEFSKNIIDDCLEEQKAMSMIKES